MNSSHFITVNKYLCIDAFMFAFMYTFIHIDRSLYVYVCVTLFKHK